MEMNMQNGKWKMKMVASSCLKSSPLGIQLQEYLAQCVVYSVSGIWPNACQQYGTKIDFP